ncbi:hypothetical protein HNQ77_002254 [Silvibacterium bohemicum]|uniref:CD-NTase-associated protein 12/Pycsar effector protein TIR domain-containing protein n=1 Tax=Silvibacterium bohemicum TaxID=1577686 RepID=A0A841JSC7_9BACT|nr:hypothetical protein [Silvibacterium bohemicum]MBB6144302.1 hypothetical protein [Silvibacterium bohemicum]
MGTIFYSWQVDRPKINCRNFIERALQSAIDRLKADIELEESLRDGLELDRDTKNVPGSPSIFDTIMQKIASASIFVPDLTFVGQRDNGRPTSNPNVLIEYGYALHKPGPLRILAVMNDLYGEPTNLTIPFNQVHRRFPITYTLAEDANDEERKAEKKSLTAKFENALRAIFESAEYVQEQASHIPSAMDVAALHQRDMEYEQALSSLGWGEGAHKVRENAKTLFAAIKTRCDEVESTFGFGVGCGWEASQRENFSCVMRNHSLGVIVGWEQPRLDSLEDARLRVREYKGRLYLPGEFTGGHIQPAKMVGEAVYSATLSRDYALGWVKAGKRRDEPSFISNDDLAETCVTQFLNLLRKE